MPSKLRAHRLDLRGVPLPLGRAGVEDQAAGAAGGVALGLRDLERLRERIGGQRDHAAARAGARTPRPPRAAPPPGRGSPAAGRCRRTSRRARCRRRAAWRATHSGARAPRPPRARARGMPRRACRWRSADRRCRRRGVPRARTAPAAAASRRPCTGRSGSASSTSVPGTSTHTRRPATRGAARFSGPLCGGPTGAPRASTISQEAACSGVARQAQQQRLSHAAILSSGRRCGASIVSLSCQRRGALSRG